MSMAGRVHRHVGVPGVRIVAALLLVATACVSTPAEHATYLREMRSAPTTFRVSPALDGEAWARAREFVSRFSSIGIRAATDTLLETYRPPRDETRYGYSITRTPARRGATFTIECLRRDRWERTRCRENAGIAATYIRTGELPYPDLIHK